MPHLVGAASLSHRLQQEETLPQHMLLESRRIAACVLAYISRYHSAVGPAFELLSILDAPTAVDFSFVLDAYKADFAQSFTAAEKSKARRPPFHADGSSRDPRL